MDGDRRHRAVLRQGHGGFAGDARARRGGVDDEDQRLAVALGDVDRGAHRAQIVRAGPGRHDHQIGMGHDLGNGLGDGGRRVDHGDADADAWSSSASASSRSSSPTLTKCGVGRLARVPPMRQAALRIGVDQGDGAGARPGRPRPPDGRTGWFFPSRPFGRPRRLCTRGIPLAAVCLCPRRHFRAMKQVSTICLK